MTETPTYAKKDFASNQEVRWCPGCGDYAILNAVQMAMTGIGKKREDIVFVSGIGCSSRFPYYMDTYGLHSIHGRATAIASGIKCQNPELSVWVITGDGDGLSIGGNHLIHAIRRNLNINIILFNNEIYGLTKGQYSPTSKIGTVTPSTPAGSIDTPFLPGRIGLGAGSTFFARTMDTDPKHMKEVFLQAEKHEGCSFVEVLQNCVIFNDKIHEKYTNRKMRDDHVFFLEHEEPIIFGSEKNKGFKMNGPKLEVVTIGEEGVTKDDIIKHDETNLNWATLINNLEPHIDPQAMGIIHRVSGRVYDQDMNAQIEAGKDGKGPKDMQALLESGATWSVD